MATMAVPPRMVVSTPVAPRKPNSITEPGRKVIRITFNTAIFLIISGIGLLFVAYAIGVRSGRARATAETPTRPLFQERVVVDGESDPPVPSAETILGPVPEKMWTIKLMEWVGETARDRVKAQQNAERIKKSLTQNGFRASYYQLVTRKRKKFVVLRYGKYEEGNASEARNILGKLRRFKYRGTAYFTHAGLETVDKD